MNCSLVFVGADVRQSLTVCFLPDSKVFLIPSVKRSHGSYNCVHCVDHLQVKVYITRSLFWDNFNPPVAEFPTATNPCIS